MRKTFQKERKQILKEIVLTIKNKRERYNNRKKKKDKHRK